MVLTLQKTVGAWTGRDLLPLVLLAERRRRDTYLVVGIQTQIGRLVDESTASQMNEDDDENMSATTKRRRVHDKVCSSVCYIQ